MDAEVKLKIENCVVRYLQNKEIAKERAEENKLLVEQLGELLEVTGEPECVIALPDGSQAVVHSKVVSREVLDRNALADEILVSKDELKTPFDFSMFTAQGKLSPSMITKYMNIEHDVKVKVTKRKVARRRKRA